MAAGHGSASFAARSPNRMDTFAPSPCSILKRVKDTFNVPIITDIHESWQAEPVAQVVMKAPESGLPLLTELAPCIVQAATWTSALREARLRTTVPACSAHRCLAGG